MEALDMSIRRGPPGSSVVNQGVVLGRALRGRERSNQHATNTGNLGARNEQDEPGEVYQDMTQKTQEGCCEGGGGAWELECQAGRRSRTKGGTT